MNNKKGKQTLSDSLNKSTQLIFYAMVDNNSIHNYVDNSIFVPFLSKYKLSPTKSAPPPISSISNITDLENIKHALRRISMECKGKNIEEGGEGVLVQIEAEEYSRE